MTTILETFGMLPVEGEVGVEIEVEGQNLPGRSFGNWSATRDGSLRGESYEYVTRKPVSLKKLASDMDTLEEKFAACNAVVNNAHRASVHIHTNVQNKTVEDLFGILFAWSMAESVWMKLCGEFREGNLFCLPSSRSGYQLSFTTDLLKVVRSKEWYKFPVKGKYDAINTDRVSDLGTVEFRTFPSSVEKSDITKWAEWCVSLVEYGSRVDRDNLTKEWKKVHDDPMNFLRGIFHAETFDGMEGVVSDLVRRDCENASDMSLIWADHKIKLLESKDGPKPKIKMKDVIQEAIMDDAMWANLGGPRPPQPLRRPAVNPFVIRLDDDMELLP